MILHAHLADTGITFNDFMVYRPSTRTWTDRTVATAKTRTYLGLTSYKGKIYAHGGMKSGMIHNNSNS